jgi:phosphotriesterase-related protein
VKALIDRGWVPRLMLGHDYAPRPVRVGVATTSEGPTRYLFVSTVAIPALLEAGVSQSDVDTMMRDVPRRFLSGES